MNTNSELLTTKQAALVMGIKPRTLCSWAQRGLIPAVRAFGKLRGHGPPYHQFLFRRDDLVSPVDEETIENVFKVEPPLQEIEGGYGYVGVVRRNTTNGTLQCHLCGHWFNNLSQHVVAGHRMKLRDYRFRFSLPIMFPLCSRKLSKRHSDNAIAHNFGAYRAPRSKGQRVSRKMLSYGRRNMAVQNKRGVCEAQLERRYLIVADTVGKDPSTADMDRYDPKLSQQIVARYGSLGKFRTKHGFECPLLRSTAYKDAALLAEVQRMYVQLGRVPMATDFDGHRPCSRVFRDHFGSWRRTLALAGFDVEERRCS